MDKYDQRKNARDIKKPEDPSERHYCLAETQSHACMEL